MSGAIGRPKFCKYGYTCQKETTLQLQQTLESKNKRWGSQLVMMLQQTLQ